MDLLLTAAIVVFVVAALGWYLVRRRNIAQSRHGDGPDQQKRR